MPKDYHEDLGHGRPHKTHTEEDKAFKEQDQLDETERARSQAGEGFDGPADAYKQTGSGQAGYRATKSPRSSRKRH